MKKVAIILLLCFMYTGNAQEEQPLYLITNIAANSALSNFGTSFYGEDKLLFSRPAKRNYIINNVWKGNGQPFLDLYVGTITDDGELIDIEKFPKPVNTKFHEADVAITKDGKTMYFTRSNYFEGKYRKDSLGINRLKMFKAVKDASGQWSAIYDIPFNNDHYSVGHPTISEDQKTLYFISDMPGTLGKTDVFKVDLHSDGTYGDPVNLGPKVNTPGKEMFPYIAGNDELYFSSNGREEGIGLLDIYKSKLSNGEVQSTAHIEAPINSDQDDFGLIINNKTREGFFTSNRSDGMGDDDIYYFKELSCDQTVVGLTKDADTGLLLAGTKVQLFKNNVLIDSLTVTVGQDAVFKFPLDCSSSYRFEGSKENYLDASITLNTNDEDEKIHEVELRLEPDDEFIVVGDKVLLKINTIYFDYDKSDIRADAEIDLNKAIKILQKYPDLIVEFGAHCDSRGRDSYNDKLSTRRANSTVDFMTENGIPTTQLTGKGYGERMLTNKCSNGVICSEEDHQLNRRTEFVIKNPEIIKSKY